MNMSACRNRPPWNLRSPRPRSVAASAMTAVLLAAGFTVAAAPAHADDAQADAGAGTACVFSSPTASGLGLGHVAWAVSDPAGDGWIFGAADGGGSAAVTSESGANSSVSGAGSVASAAVGGVGSSVPVGLSVSASGISSISSGSTSASPSMNSDRPATPGVPDYAHTREAPRVWVARADSFETVRHDFGSFGWYESYRCKQNVVGADASNAYATAASDTGFNIVTNNCLEHVRTILLAYQPQIIAQTNFRTIPNDWYDHLRDEGFADSAPVQAQ